MKNILEEGLGPVWDEIAREQPLVVFDFDGTLAPIVERPGLACMRPSTRRLLRLVSLMFPCAVVSGRARADVLARLEGVPLLAVVGNHGAEPGFGPVDRTLRGMVEGWIARVGPRVSEIEGAFLEDKRFSIAIHYRSAAARSAARRAVLAAVRDLPGARVFGGHAVVNAVPVGSHDKGMAIGRLLQRLDRRAALYVGDDATDEDAFSSRHVAVSIRVGRTHRSAARYYVPGQSDVDELLRKLVRARRHADGLDDCIEGLERSVA
jgi:trehalose 6-phosphate phosphatase